MNLSDLNSGPIAAKAFLSPICNNITCNNINANNLSINNLSANNINANDLSVTDATGTYDASISVTGCNNVVDSQKTHFIKSNMTYTIFGNFRGDVQAVSHVVLNLNLVPGTTSTLSNRSFYLHSNKNTGGAKAFITCSEGNNSPTNLALSCNTYDQNNANPANQLNTTFYYSLSYVSEV